VVPPAFAVRWYFRHGLELALTGEPGLLMGAASARALYGDDWPFGPAEGISLHDLLPRTFRQLSVWLWKLLVSALSFWTEFHRLYQTNRFFVD
jgi:hypothetical protein